MRSRTNKALLILEYISAFVSINELRKIVDALIQDKSFVECKSYLKQSTLFSLGEKELLIAQIFTINHDIPAAKRYGFISQLNDFTKALPLNIAETSIVQSSPILKRPEHDAKWLQFEQDYFINNNPIGGDRLNQIDHYGRLSVSMSKSLEWFLSQIYHDPTCLSPIQKEELSQRHPEALHQEAAQSSFVLMKRESKQPERLGHFALSDEAVAGPENNNDDDDDDEKSNSDENEEGEGAFVEATQLAKKSKKTGKKKLDLETEDPLLAKHVDDVLQKAFAKVTNSSDTRFFQKTVEQSEGRFLKNLIFIPPQDLTKSDAENYALGLKISKYLQDQLSGRPTTNILVQPPKDVQGRDWQEKNKFRNKKNELVGNTIPSDKPVGTVAIRSTTCGRLKEKLYVYDDSVSESNDESSDISLKSLAKNSSALFAPRSKADVDNSSNKPSDTVDSQESSNKKRKDRSEASGIPVVAKPLPTLNVMMAFFRGNKNHTATMPVADAGKSEMTGPS